MMHRFSHSPTPEEMYKRKYISSSQKAKHLSDRMKQFLSDLDKSTLKAIDKAAIKELALSFLNN